MSLLYEAEAKGLAPGAVLADLALQVEPFVADLVEGVGRNLARIDGLIGRFAVGWAVDRMPAVDRSLLRLAVYELIEHPDVPAGVVISEAVELAAAYSTADSSRFVNGVLAGIAAEVRDA